LRNWFNRLIAGRLQIVLIASFSLIAALTVGLNALAVSRVIEDYLEGAQDRRVARDMDLAEAFYQLKMAKVNDLANRVAHDPIILNQVQFGNLSDAQELDELKREIQWHVSVANLEGTYWILILDDTGGMISGGSFRDDGELLGAASANWGELPIVLAVNSSVQAVSGTEIIPADLLATVGLDQRAQINLVDTPRAAPQPFDPREGSAGLALVNVHPIESEQGGTIGSVVVGHLFNNDFTLVDRIREVAGVDTVTIFFGDLRVSTNVPDEKGERAVGTRVSEEVRQVVLEQGQPYKGEAFVVKEAFITRYEPLRDHDGQVVGSLYVGARLSTFHELVTNLMGQVTIIALISILLAGVIAVPVARVITRPIAALVEATEKLARGDMNVEVSVEGSGELALLSHSFNSMVRTLQDTQQELLQKEKLASMGQLSAGVAHEINNPLGSILLLSGVVHKEMKEGDPGREDLEMIIDEATRCKRIVSDLLNFARQQEVLAQPTNLNELLDKVLESLARQELFEQIEIGREYESLPMIQIDPAQMQQVFVNLFTNAAEAMEGKGVLRLETGAIDPDWVQIKVSDSGCGIAHKDLGKLFTPFYTTKGPGKGTGLGLSIVYGIIKMHRGQISVQSQPGEGTTITILLPVRPFQPVEDQRTD
jgi:two-component system NtrC family sensor kinase